MTLKIILLTFATLFLLFFLLFLFLKVNFSVNVKNKDIFVKVGFFTVYNSAKVKKKPQNKVNKDEKFEQNYKNTKQIINLIRKIFDDRNDDLVKILKYMKKTLTVKRLDLSLEYGFSEAAVTGVAGGLIWSVISAASAYIGRYFDIKKLVNIAVKPNYSKEVFEFKLYFESRIRILHLAKTIRHILRFKDTLKGGR